MTQVNPGLHKPRDDSQLTTAIQEGELWIGNDATAVCFNVSQHLEDLQRV
jgi:hypothetical protein